MAFSGARILSLESRRADEMAILIRKQGGDPFIAPSMREVELSQQEDAFEFGRRLIAGDFDAVILLTGGGTRLLWKTLLTRFPESALKAALEKTTTIVRGPKPSAALREIGLIPTIQIPEPNTWREILHTMDFRPELRVAMQEYGEPNRALLDGLHAQHRHVFTIHLYGWELPEDTAPIREAAAKLCRHEFDAAIFTTSMQIVNLMKIAEETGIERRVLDGLRAIPIASIGPATTETLDLYGLKADFEPSHPKMGLLVNELAAKFSELAAL